MKKAFDQTVRDLKREVNKKVLKVPGIEQKVLDATSNEPWGPHGTLLADIAQASRNYHEYQMIMTVIWKRINDTGKNWRHVYKALTVLEYMVANGSERVIDEIREHAYQIQTLSNFQYIDSSGKDQGNNVRRKSQSLVVLVNDKERIAEVRQKAAANRDKFRSASSAGGMYRPGSYSDGGYGDRYDDYRDGGRDDDRNGRDQEWGYKDGDSYRDGDRYGRDSDERYGRDSYRDGEYRGRSRSTDDYQYGSRSRSSDRDRERTFEDDGQYSSRGSAGRADDGSLEQRLERKFSEQNIVAPPSYEEAVTESRSPGLSERDAEMQAASVPKPSSPPVSNNTVPQVNPPSSSASPPQQDFETFDEFDPRVPISAPPTTSKSPEEDLLGSLSESFNPLAIMPVTPLTTTPEVEPSSVAGVGPTYAVSPSVSNVTSQPFGDPFGDTPFRATPSTDSSRPTPTASFQPAASQIPEQPHAGVPKAETVVEHGFGQSSLTYAPPTDVTYAHSYTSSSGFPSQPHLTPNPSGDVLADILPPSGPAVIHTQQPGPNVYGGFNPQPAPVGQAVSQIPHMQAGSTGQFSHGSFQQVPAIPANSQATYQGTNYGVFGGSIPQAGQGVSMTSQPANPSSSGALALVPQQPNKDKFETKSTVWADTLSRGLVNLNISGSKTNPLADIGVDFDALNRKERRMEKPPANPPVSTITMGKAMGSGTGMGRAGTSGLRPPSNPMAGPGMGMSMGMGGGPGSSMGSYRGMGQPMGMGMGQPMGLGMGMGMNPAMAQGGQTQRPGFPAGSTMAGGYNPMMGSGGYTQQPYGGGYR